MTSWQPSPAEMLMLKTLAEEWVIDHDMPRAYRAAAERCEVDVDRLAKLHRNWGFTFGALAARAALSSPESDEVERGSE